MALRMQSQSLHPLTDTERKQGVNVLLANGFFTLLGYFTLVTVISLHYTHDLRFTAAAVGLALAVRQLTQQGLDIFGGFFAERIGYRISIAIGTAIRATGFFGIGFAKTLPQLLFFAFIAGFGGMFFDAAGSGAFAAVTLPQDRPRKFAIQATLNNVGAAIGPILGITLYTTYGFTIVAIVAALAFYWVSTETLLWLPDKIERRISAASVNAKAMPFGATLKSIVHNRTYVIFVVMLFGYWLIAIQPGLTVPLATNAIAGPRGVAIVLGLNAFLAIPLQYPLVRFVERFLGKMQILAISTLFTAIGLSIIFLGQSLSIHIIGIIIVTIGSLACTPITASITAHVAPSRALAMFYGFTALGIGVGGALGQYAGGRIFDMQSHLHLPWLLGVFTLIIGALIAGAFWTAKTPEPVREPIAYPDLSLHQGESGVVTLS